MKVALNEIQRRNVVKYDKVTGIFNNGLDNAYPQRVERIINNSVTAKAALNKAMSFFIGQGFEDKTLNDVIVYEDVNGKVTAYKLLTEIARNISRHLGAACQIQYDRNFDIAGVKPVPFRNFRYGKKDSYEYSGFGFLYNNWDRKIELKYDAKKAQKIHMYNPNKAVVESQFKDEKYTGQISVLKLDDEFIYPLSQIDAVLEDADTEAQIKAFKNGELRKGFFAKYILYHTRFNNEGEQLDFKEKIKRFESGEHDASVLMAEAEFDDDGNFIKSSAFQLQKIEQNINDKIFESYEHSVANNIRKAAWNIPSILIEQQDGALFGSSGEALKAAFDIYNSETQNVRSAITQYLKEIFSHSANSELKNKEFNIKKLTYEPTLDNSGATAD